MGIKRRNTLVACMLASSMLLAACSTGEAGGGGAKPESGGKPAEPAKTEQNGALGKYNPPITLHIARSSSQNWKYPKGDDLNNNIWTRAYEEKLGIKLALDWTGEDGSGAAYEQKMNVSIASGNLPDLFTVNATQLKQLADAGQLADLTEVYNKYASPLTKQNMNSDGGLGLKSATFGGKLLAIPSIGANIYSPSLLWIRTDWLKKLNLPEPKTMQDVYAISDAFTNRDPDGNGKKDTIGLGLSKTLLNAGVGELNGFANAFHAYPTLWIKGGDGKITYGSIQPQMKAALAKLQDMYKNGKIDTEFGVKDTAKLGEDIASNKLGMLFGANWLPYLPLIDAVKKNPGMDWKAYAIPSVDNEPAKAGVGFPTYAYVVVRKGYEHPEAAVSMLNFYQDTRFKTPVQAVNPFETVEENGNRIETVKYAVVQSGLGNDLVVNALKLLREALQKDDKSVLKNALKETDKFDPVRAFQKNGDMTYWSQGRQYNAYEVLLDNYAGDRLLTTEFGGRTQTMGEKWEALDKLEKETFTKIIMGASSVDEFDNFVGTWKKLGGDTIIKEVNDYLASQK